MQNVGFVDRVVQVCVGVVVLALVFVGPRTAWGLVGLLPLATGSVGRCPLYRMLGIDTRSAAERAGSSGLGLR
jgi:Inner membrane protein YgaP-like, transmembrane domain